MRSKQKTTEMKLAETAVSRISVILLTALLCILFCTAAVFSQTSGSVIQISVPYSGVGKAQQFITVDYADEWFLRPDHEYNHKLMQLSFALAAAGFRDKQHRLSEKDANILKFYSRAGFSRVRTDDFNRETSADTIASAIASKKIGDTTVIAVSVSGNNYQNEWLSNLTLGSEERARGFATAAEKVLGRIREYISANALSGELRLWVSGYSRAAAVSNILAADATDSGLFAAVYGYTIATPRTTKDEDAGRFSNIFNIINPFDPVPMVPFPEWGYVRYGKDLFLPSRETDSSYAEKKVRADELCMEAKGHPLHYNPQINAQIHTILDYSLFYINSSNSYKDTFQNGILAIWQSRDFRKLAESIAQRLISLPDITEYQINEFTSLLDYLLQITYTNFRAHVLHIGISEWDPTRSIKENVMHEHFDESYRFWLFSSDDPNEIFANDPRYAHFTVLGDVDIMILDQDQNFIEEIKSDGTFSYEPDKELFPDAVLSSVRIFAARQDEQALIVLPMDQDFLILIRSLKDQTIRTAYVDYSAKSIRGDVQHILSEKLAEGEYTVGILGNDVIDDYTDEELLQYGFTVIEPWSRDIVYSPSAVMRLENTGIFHPTVRFILTMGVLLLLLLLYVIIMSTIGTGSLIKKGVKKIRNRRAGSKAPGAGSEKILPDPETRPEEIPADPEGDSDKILPDPNASSEESRPDPGENE